MLARVDLERDSRPVSRAACVHDGEAGAAGARLESGREPPAPSSAIAAGPNVRAPALVERDLLVELVE
jgi:hypothetical protein